MRLELRSKLGITLGGRISGRVNLVGLEGWREMSREVPREGEIEESERGRDERGEERDCDKSYDN